MSFWIPAHSPRAAARLGACALTALALPALGQSALEEVIVVAQKREQRLQEVPVAVSALGAEAMDGVGVTDLRDIVALSPSVSFGAAQAIANAIYIRVRGVGTTGNNAGFESSVGVFIDDVYQPRPGLALAEFVDIDRVEVLRGPQGTLFGRNTSAGALNVKTAAPVIGERAGHAKLTLGSLGLIGVQGAYNLDAGERFALRFAGALRQRDGAVEAITAGQEDSDDRDRVLVRAQGLYRASDALSFRVALDYADSKEICCAPVQVTRGIAASLRPDAGMPALPSGVTVFGDDIRESDSENRFEDTTQLGFSARMNWRAADAVNLSWILGYRDAEAAQWGDVDFSKSSFLFVSAAHPYESALESLSSELRVQGLAFGDRLDWMVGLFAADESISERNANTAGRDLLDTDFDDNDAGPVYGQTARGLFEQDTSVLSLFTHNIIDLSERFQLILGLRYVDESKDGGLASSEGDDVGCVSASTGLGDALAAADEAQAAAAADPSSDTLTAAAQAAAAAARSAGGAQALSCAAAYTSVAASEAARMAGDTALGPFAEALGAAGQNPFAAQRYGLYRSEFEDDALTAYVNLSYDFSDAVTAYFSFSQGFKSGGINLDVTGTGFFDPIFESETIDSLELGLKSTLLDGRMTLNVAAYRMDIENLQIVELDGLSFTVFGVPEASASGLEVDAAALLGEGLALRVGLALTDTEADLQRSHSGPFEADFGGPCNKFHFTPTATVCGSSGLTNAPETVLTLGLDWTLALGGGQRLSVTPNVRYESDSLTHTADLTFEQDASTVLDLRVGLAAGDGSWSVEMWGRNLTDEVVFTRSFGALAGTFSFVSGATASFINQGRTVGLSGRYEF